jgi:D-alanyl-D-alanine endopeptidase (penicillin-binding protein 7)
MIPDGQIPSPNSQILPPRDNRFKILISVCILIIIIGLVNTARMKEQKATATKTVTMNASNNSPDIDSSFFNYNSQPAAVPSVAHQQSVPSPRAQTPTPVNIITADSYLVGNLTTGKIYFEKDPTVVRPIASISKLFTAIVAEKRLDPNAIVTVASSSITGFDSTSSPSTIIPGESFTVHDILYDMLLVSSNDAATTIADNYANVAGDANPNSRADFVSLMNASAASLGMTETSFKDPSGLSSSNISSADDLFKLARYLYDKEPGILAIEKTPEYDVPTTTAPNPVHNAHTFVNIDPFVYDPHYIGGKTGRTDAAGETMLSLFNLSINGVDNPIAIIVLHSDQDSRQIDSSILVGKVLGLISGE